MEGIQNIQKLTPEILGSNSPIWINPVGGMGDVIMLSTALKRAFERYGKKFNVVRRSQYTDVFTHHPAIQSVGHPDAGSLILCNDYWSRPNFCDVHQKALWLMYDIFSVGDERNEELFFPEIPEENAATQLIVDNVPWTDKTVIISCSSASPRKIMHPAKWHNVVQRLLSQQCFVVQVGSLFDVPIHGAYSLLGATRILQMPSILEKANLVITHDNFIMHAAKLMNIPTIVLFGPTEKERYGYEGHVCLQADNADCEYAKNCLGPHVPQNYATPCPLCERHCMNRFDEARIVDYSMSILTNK